MTPKEEAKRLHNHFMSIIPMAESHTAMECALFTVEEIINTEKESGVFKYIDLNKPKMVDLRGSIKQDSYWEEVKNQIILI